MSKLAIVVGLLAVMSFGVISTGAYSAVTAPRSADIAVSDENALVGLDQADTVVVGDRSDLVTVTNRLDDPIDVTVTLADRRQGKLYADDRMQDETITITIAPGASETIELRANNRADTAKYTLTADGGGVNISFGTESVDVQTPAGNGKGNA